MSQPCGRFAQLVKQTKLLLKFKFFVSMPSIVIHEEGLKNKPSCRIHPNVDNQCRIL